MVAELPDQAHLPVVRNRVAEQERVAIAVRDVEVRFLCRCGRDHFITCGAQNLGAKVHKFRNRADRQHDALAWLWPVSHDDVAGSIALLEGK